jgi:hypothetical protein
LVWDDNISPTGAAEQWDHTFGSLEVFATAGQFVYQAAAGNGIWNGIGSGSDNYDTFMFGEQVGFKYNFDKNTYFKAGATLYTYSGTSGNNSVTTVPGLYSDTALNLSSAALNTSTGALPGTVATGPGKSLVITGAENNSPSFYNGPFVGAANAPLTNTTGINDLAVLEVPFEFDFKVGPGVHRSSDPKGMTETTGWSLPIRIFGDFAYNIDADERADAARNAINNMLTTGVSNLGVTAAPTHAENVTLVNSPTYQGVLTSGKSFLDQAAYEIGVEAGQLKKKGDWDAKLWWQSTGYYAVDPNLISSELFNAAPNMQGVAVSISHNWTDGLSSTLKYAHGFPVNGLLATPNYNEDLTLGDMKQYNLFQADLMWSF